MTKTATPRIYAACLASYNNGDLHGTWIDCDQDAEEINKEIKAMLELSPEEDAEEFAIHDFYQWQGIQIDEYQSIDKVAELAPLIIKYGKAFAAHYNHYGTDSSEETFNNSYQCECESERAFIRELWEENGQLKELEKLGISDHWIDWDAIARDQFINCYYSESVDNKVYVFSRI